MSSSTSVYILTDTHYLSPAMWEEGTCISDRERGDQIAIKYTPQILRSFFKKIIEDKDNKYVLITGDLINNGDIRSHRDFISELKMLTDAGKTVFVTCATHDYAGLGDDENIFHAVYYKPDECIEAERIYKTELPSLYYEFGHRHADSIHEESGSYSVLLDGGVRLIAIYDNGNGRSHCGLFEDGFRWLEDEIIKARKNSECIFLAVHHPVLPPWQIYCDIAEFEMFGGYKKLRELMCRHNVRLIFTGHTHVHGIKKYEDSEGRYFYDVTTSALPGAKGRMRKAVFDTENKTCDITSIGIDVIEGADTGGLSAEEYIFSLNFAGLFKKSLPLMDTDWDAFIDNVEHVFNPRLFREHPRISKMLIKRFMKLKMSLPARIGGKETGLTREEKKYLKDIYGHEVLFTVLAHVFSGDAPYNPDTPEYKAVTGAVKRIGRLLKLFGKDIDSFVPGSQGVLDVMNPFMYNTRTGNDKEIFVELEK